jgi:hypothetical protein
VDYCRSTYLKILKKKGKKKTFKSYFRATNTIFYFYLLGKKKKEEGSLSYVVPTFVVGNYLFGSHCFYRNIFSFGPPYLLVSFRLSYEENSFGPNCFGSKKIS